MSNHEIKFWKSVGGSAYLIKWKGRWHWGHGVRFGLNFSKVARKHGYKLVRVKEPEALKRAWSKHGATLSTLKKEFPPFDIEMLIPRNKKKIDMYAPLCQQDGGPQGRP